MLAALLCLAALVPAVAALRRATTALERAAASLERSAASTGRWEAGRSGLGEASATLRRSVAARDHR